jgi:hypothetical protein
LFGGVGWVRYDGASAANYCTAYAAAVVAGPGGYTCNPNFSASMLGGITRWTPVKNLTFSAEAIWMHLNQGFTGSATFAPGAPQPSQLWTFKDQDTLSLNVRVQRNF